MTVRKFGKNAGSCFLLLMWVVSGKEWDPFTYLRKYFYFGWFSSSVEKFRRIVEIVISLSVDIICLVLVVFIWPG